MNSKLQQSSRAVLNYLFQKQAASRIQISHGLKMRPGTVGEICDNLIKSKHICPIDAGRQRNVMLKLNADKYMAIGVEHTAEGLIAVILSADLSVKLQERIIIPETVDGQERLLRIVAGIDRLIQKSHCRSAVNGLGFCDIGMFDSHTGRSICSELLPAWNDMPVKETLEKALKTPVVLLGKMDETCVVEHKFGVAKEWKTFVCVMLDRVIGMSVMNGEQIVRGNDPVYGELGHMVSNPAGEICKCGNRGCLETVASTDAVVKKVRSHMTPADVQIFDASADELTIENVIQAAQKGHKLAETALLEAAGAAGLALAQIVTVFGIKNIVLSGRLVKVGDLFLDPLKRTLRQYCVHPLNAQLEIVTSSLDEWSSARGAAYSVLENYFSTRILHENRAIFAFAQAGIARRRKT
ncbi:MAG: ROK family protein [Kiritimatiellia bacterium]|nr:ROK family protein [Kiritimatiellia bacterium]